MTKHARAILKKMKGSDYPELSFDFAYKLTNESERGAILIGASKIEDALTKLILDILPSKQKSYTSKLFNYPGPLSSLSGKIELTYAFGVIDKEVYDSLNALRQIRNDAAHSNDVFSLQVKKEKLEKIYGFEYGFADVIHQLAYNNLIAWKKGNLRSKLTEKNLTQYDPEELWEKHVNEESSKIIQEHLTVWKLAYGLTFLCLKIEVIRDEQLKKRKL